MNKQIVSLNNGLLPVSRRDRKVFLADWPDD